MEDFLSPRLLNLELLFLNSKLCLVMKIDKSQVPTTKQSLEFRFSLSNLSIPDQREVLHLVYINSLNTVKILIGSSHSFSVPPLKLYPVRLLPAQFSLTLFSLFQPRTQELQILSFQRSAQGATRRIWCILSFLDQMRP